MTWKIVWISSQVERRFRVGLPSERPAALKSSPLQGKKVWIFSK
jgi:hypothetical protein